MQHSIKDLWLYPFPEIDVVHTQEPLLPEPELTTPGRCICCRQNVRHRFRLDDSWPLRQLTDTISDTRVRLNKATEHLDKLKKRGEPVATGEKEKYNTAVKAAERALEHARLSARRLSLRHVQKAEITSTEPLSGKEQELFHEDGPPYSLCAFCHAWHSLNGYAAAQGVMVWLRSIYHGAGTADTPAALTWDQKQIDAATAYMKNTSRPSAGRALGKGEVNTQSGRTYVGLQNEYNGIIDSASNPQLTLIADSTPDESTRKALAETLQSDSAAAYFDQVASPEAKARGYMSTREFEAFEAGRRYANTAYLVDLQEMQGDNLLRELVRITAQMNWQLNDLKEQIRQGNVISGQQLALTARQYYEKQLGSLEKTINQANAR